MTTTLGDLTLESAGDTFQTSFGLPEGDVRGLGLNESCEKRSEGEVGYFTDPREFYNVNETSSTSKIHHLELNKANMQDPANISSDAVPVVAKTLEVLLQGFLRDD
jgi:hypothetical protein